MDKCNNCEHKAVCVDRYCIICDSFNCDGCPLFCDNDWNKIKEEDIYNCKYFKKID